VKEISTRELALTIRKARRSSAAAFSSFCLLAGMCSGFLRMLGGALSAGGLFSETSLQDGQIVVQTHRNCDNRWFYDSPLPLSLKTSDGSPPEKPLPPLWTKPQADVEDVAPDFRGLELRRSGIVFLHQI